MHTRHQPPTPPPAPPSHRGVVVRRLRPRQGGFNFTEVLFAVMILGIGFIMTAAIFPVALQQTKLTGEEVVASTVARGGVNYVAQVGAVPGHLPLTDLNVTAAGTPPGPAAGAALTPEPALANNETRYVPGKVVSFRDDRFQADVRDDLWRLISGNFILPEDTRTGWVGLYSRGVTYTNLSGAAAAPGTAGVIPKPDTFAKVIVIGVNVRSRAAYEYGKDLRRYPKDDPPADATDLPPATLEPLTVYVKTTEGDLAPDTITFYTDAAGGTAQTPDAAAEGAYVVISDDRRPEVAGGPRENGLHNGKVYRLAAATGNAGEWELDPGQDMPFTNPDGTVGNTDDVHENIPFRPVGQPPAGVAAVAFLVGRGYADPTTPANGYDGPSQDAGLYIGFVPAN